MAVYSLRAREKQTFFPFFFSFCLIGENVTVCRNDQHPLVQLWARRMSSFLGGTRSGKAVRSKSIQQKKKKKTKEKVERKKVEVRNSSAYKK
jgi:hypothetical protein